MVRGAGLSVISNGLTISASRQLYPRWRLHTQGRSYMTTQIKLAATLASSFVFGCIGFGALHAQTNISPAFWVTETLEVSDQPAFLNVIKAVTCDPSAFRRDIHRSWRQDCTRRGI